MSCNIDSTIFLPKTQLDELSSNIEFCPVQWALRVAEIGKSASCGESVMCRSGINQLWNIIYNITMGKAQKDDLILLEELAENIRISGACELAVIAADSIMASITRYREEWDEHVMKKVCKRGLCEEIKEKRVVKVTEERKKFYEKSQVDLVILGAGMAGLTAALQAAELGLSVICLEKSGTTGGSANVGMAIFAVESKFQKAQMESWTRDDAFLDFMTLTNWKADAATVRRWFNMSSSTIEWIEEKGIEFLGVYKSFLGSHAVQHMIRLPGANRPVERQATVLIKAFTEEAAELGAEIRFNHAAKRLIIEDGRVVGVVAVDPDGSEYEIYADAVIVGTGGFGSNLKMIESCIEFINTSELSYYSIPGADGDGINMIWSAGGEKTPISLEMKYNIPGITDVYKALSETMRQPSAIMVNIEGNRVTNESIMSNTTFTGNAIMSQTGQQAFTIVGKFDVDYMKKHGLDYMKYHHGVSDLDEFDKEVELFKNSLDNQTENKNFWVCNSIEEIAEVTGIDYTNLVKTIERYNSFCGVAADRSIRGTILSGDLSETTFTGGYDADFLKAAKYLRPVIGERYYVARLLPAEYGTFGGVKVNNNMQVIGTNGAAIPGLFSCGKDAAGVFAGEQSFYDPGMVMSWAINSGIIAAIETAKYLK